MKSKYLVFDIGGTNLKYGLFSESGNLLEHCVIETPKKGLKVFLNSIFSIIEQYQFLIKGIAFS